MYDYIIVGAGSAGCVLANRLSQNPAISVLLLEAGGPDRRREIHIPAAFPFLFRTECDWGLETEPQTELNGRRLYWPLGKVLGGTSSMNGMIYMRGHPHDYDDWRDLGNRGWGYADVLPFFKKAQHQERGASEYHGVGGPLNVTDLQCVNPLTRCFLQATQSAGFDYNSDFNGPTQEGAGLHQVTQKRGKRHSTAVAYLRPARSRPNLTIRTHARATRILLEDRRAVGVEYLQGEEKQTEGTKLAEKIQERARRGVILAGGAVHSTQLLLLSGIGPGDTLADQGIPVFANLPGVGHNLQDHLQASVIHDCTRPWSLAGTESLLNLLRFVLLGRGPYTSNVGEGGLFVKSSPQQPRPDIEIIFAPNYSMRHGFDNPPGDGYTLAASLLRPRSRGVIRLRSRDPLAPPVIQPRYLSAEADISTLLTGLKLARHLAAQRAFDPVRGPEVRPGPNVVEDQALIDFIRATAETLYHPVGTCKMGHDAYAVVDERLRVHQIQGLRVADASIMPTLIGGNTNAPVIMIAEKAAHMILEDDQ